MSRQYVVDADAYDKLARTVLDLSRVADEWETKRNALRRTIELQANDLKSVTFERDAAITRHDDGLSAWTANSAHWAQVLYRISDIASAGGPDACAHILDVIKRGS